MNNKTFRILSIDGGGIKGLYASKVLERIQAEFGGKHFCDHFDMICGTSTGGLIALALTLRMDVANISDFYISHGETIFPRRSWFVRNYGQLYRNLYSAKKLRSAIVEFFGTKRKLSECQSLLCIPSYKVSRGEPIVFKRPCQTNKYTRDGKINVLDVALATASAPTYFRNHTIDQKGVLEGTICTNGGIWANNPALCGLHEAWDHYVGKGKEFDSVAILSISTAPKPSGSDIKGGGIKHWREKLTGASLSGQSFFTNHFLKMLTKGNIADVSYQRIVPKNLSSQEQKLLEMDSVDSKSLKKLSELGTQSGHDFITQQREWITPFFDTKKSYNIQ